LNVNDVLVGKIIFEAFITHDVERSSLASDAIGRVGKVRGLPTELRAFLVAVLLPSFFVIVVVVVLPPKRTNLLSRSNPGIGSRGRVKRSCCRQRVETFAVALDSLNEGVCCGWVEWRALGCGGRQPVEMLEHVICRWTKKIFLQKSKFLLPH
jgi:hypothetical protein